jgi:hypothetical protein
VAITVDWGSKVITVPRADMLLIQPSPEIRQLDVDTFRLALKDLEDDVEGIPHPTTHNHNPPVTVAGTPLARVVEIINGYSVTFEDGQYRVILVGANNNILDVANLNQVSIAPTNSAGLQDLNSLQAASFDGAVSLDVNSIYDGTSFPVGTRAFPVNNTADALAISVSRGLRTITILSSMTLDSGDWSNGYTFTADGPVITALTLDTAVNISNCSFENMTLQGVADGLNTIRGCVINDLSDFSGNLIECAIDGSITLAGGAQTSVFDSWSNVPGGGVGQYPTINMGGTGGQSLAVRNYHGGIAITGSSDAANIGSLDIGSGRVIFDSSVTDGSFTVRGNATIMDDSVSPASVINNTINAANEASEYAGRVSIDAVNGTSGVEYPAGTPSNPVDNLADALVIADQRGIADLHFYSDYTFQPGDNVSLKTLSGENASLVQLSFLDGAITAGCTFKNVTVDGFLISPVLFERVIFLDITGNATGPALGVMQVRDSTFKGIVTLSSSLVAHIEVVNSVSGAGGTAVFDINDALVDISFHNYVGDMEVRGFTQAANELIVSYGGGTITLDSSNTAGTAWLRGIADIVDQTGGMTVNDETMTFDSETVVKLLRNKTVTDPATGVMTVYDDDGVIPLFTAQLYEDATELQTYRGQGAEVRERLT